MSLAEYATTVVMGVLALGLLVLSWVTSPGECQECRRREHERENLAGPDRAGK